MNPYMQYSLNGKLLTQSFESCRLQAYPDSKGIPTIGWGHTRGVELGDTCTQLQADNWLEADVGGAVYAVNHYVAITLNQQEFDSLCDLVFNIGSGNFSTSTMLKKLNCGDIAGAAAEFVKWDHAGGVEVAGLLRRRIAERDEFLS
jgi:lysozyme